MPWEFGDGETLVVLAPMPAARLEERAASHFKKNLPDRVTFEGGGHAAMLLRCSDDRAFPKKLSTGASPVHAAIGNYEFDPFTASTWSGGKETKPAPPPDIFDLAEDLGCPIPDRLPSAVVTEARPEEVDPEFESAWLFQADGDVGDLARRAVNAALGYLYDGPREVTLVRGSGRFHALIASGGELTGALAPVLAALTKEDVYFLAPPEYRPPADAPDRPGVWRVGANKSKTKNRQPIDEDPFVFAESLGVRISAKRPLDWPSLGVRALRPGDLAAYGGYSWVILAPMPGDELSEWTRRYRRKHVNPNRQEWIIVPGDPYSAVLDPEPGTMFSGEEEFAKALSREVQGPVLLGHIDEHTLDYGDGEIYQWIAGRRKVLKKSYIFSEASSRGVRLPGE